ncbi:MAG: DEAD/DEAH box helicase [Nitrospirae bacterium]|nr:MAG: DEAD/DEAH box helicase [Nitrospirota bacterium]
MPLSQFHPLIAEWFEKRFGRPTDVQVQSWPAVMSGEDTLIAAPTGSGKTLAAFLTCIDSLLKQALACELEDRTQVLYVSPLKALSNDVQKNLQQPLLEISEAALAAGLLMPEIRVDVRTGDTPAWQRQRMLKRPPHILITTPESFFLLLTAEKSRQTLRDVRTVIVDEVHAVAPNKRGAHLALSLERLDALTHVKPIRIGLSATQRPIEEIAKFLVGQGRANGDGPRCRIVDMGHRRPMDIAVETPKDEIGAVATNAIWSDIYDRLAELVREHQTTLIFVNTRRLAERISHHLAERLGEERVAAHHGSLARRLRLSAEERLKLGQIDVVVATASLELGIDIGTVNLVCLVGSPRAIATGLQRIGRSGHWVGAMPKGRLFPTTRDELIECAALVRSIRAGMLDRITIPREPLDILAQQIVAASATQEWRADTLYELCRRAYSYRDVSRRDFDAVIHMLADGFATGRGRRGASVHHDRINHRLRGRRGSRLAALTSGGAIPETANYAVIAEPEGLQVGTVDEDFAVESLAGDIILLGNSSWRIRGVENGRVRVEDAHGAPPSIPFWRGEAPSRTAELSHEVATVRATLQPYLKGDPEGGIAWLERECGLDRRGAEQVVAYLQGALAILGDLPTQQTVIAERFFDESGGMQLVLHAPFGGRINRAWGLALRKRFCASFDLELQAAATDEGIVISLGERHSFPLDSVFEFLKPATVREVLIQAVLASPMFMSRWRWNTTRALALLKFSNGRRVPPQVQRMRAEDLLTSVFPDATGCQDNHHGPIVIPEHPLVFETLRDCLTEALDIDGLTTVLHAIERGAIRGVAVESPEPSPLSHEILNSNPFAYLDDAPLEERRARAVQMRRSLPSDVSERLGALDVAAIAQVVDEARPEVRDPDELHDALLSLIWVPEDQAPEWKQHVAALVETGRAAVITAGQSHGWVATERLGHAQAVFPAFLEGTSETLQYEEAVTAIVQGWMETIGPVSAAELAERLHLPATAVQGALLKLESAGQVLRGRFRPDQPEKTEEWCDRRLLARIHRLTTATLRREIEPVATSDFIRFLLRWQHCAPGSQLHGEAGLLEVLRQLAGFEAAGPAWERRILPARVAGYKPELLDRLCLSGLVSWGRLSPPVLPKSHLTVIPSRPLMPTSVAPINLFPREEAEWLLEFSMATSEPRAPLSSVAQDVFHSLSQRGASFFTDLVRLTKHLPAEVEAGLWELVVAGLVTADGFDSLRALMDPRRRRAEGKERTRRPRHSAGRWSLFRTHLPAEPGHRESTGGLAERMARQLLRRYGVVFRDLLQRESLALPWRDLLVQYRRLELRGEIRGGRFVGGFTGEQFAQPEAVEALRTVRRDRDCAAQEIKVSGADPLNLVGIITPGSRVPGVSGNDVIFRDGAPVILPGRQDAAIIF